MAKILEVLQGAAAVAKGMTVTFKEMMQPAITEDYPDAAPNFQERYRGVHVLQRDENGLEKCVACFLCAEHFRPVIALNGPDGLAHARLLQPAAIICDSCMPGMDGLEVIETLRQNSVTTHIPILLMSGHGPGRFDGSGANAFLPKPIRVDEMLALIRSLTTAKQTEPALAGTV